MCILKIKVHFHICCIFASNFNLFDAHTHTFYLVLSISIYLNSNFNFFLCNEKNLKIFILLSNNKSRVAHCWNKFRWEFSFSFTVCICNTQCIFIIDKNKREHPNWRVYIWTRKKEQRIKVWKEEEPKIISSMYIVHM